MRVAITLHNGETSASPYYASKLDTFLNFPPDAEITSVVIFSTIPTEEYNSYIRGVKFVCKN